MEPATTEAAPEASFPSSASGLSGHATLASGDDQREGQALDSQIQETSKWLGLAPGAWPPLQIETPFLLTRMWPEF